MKFKKLLIVIPMLLTWLPAYADVLYYNSDDTSLISNSYNSGAMYKVGEFDLLSSVIVATTTSSLGHPDLYYRILNDDLSCANANVTFDVFATSSPAGQLSGFGSLSGDYEYQWTGSGADGSGTTTKSLSAPSSLTASAGHYAVYANVACNGSGNFKLYGTALGSFFGWITTNGDAPALISNRTRVTDVAPTDGATIATSTPFLVGAVGYINPDDFEEGLTVTQQIIPNTLAVAGPVLSAIDGVSERVYTYEATTSGSFYFSTTTDLATIGGRKLITTINKPRFSVLGFNFGSKELDRKQTRFLIGTTTEADLLLNIYDGSVTALGENASTTLALNSCNPITSSFSVFDCMVGLIFVSGDQARDLYTFFNTSVLRRAPMGYVTRFVEIIGSSATTTLPMVSLTLATSSPMAGTLSFDPNAIINQGSTILTSWTAPSGDNIWDIAMPPMRKVLYLMLALKIISELIGLGHVGGGKKHTDRATT